MNKVLLPNHFANYNLQLPLWKFSFKISGCFYSFNIQKNILLLREEKTTGGAKEGNKVNMEKFGTFTVRSGLAEMLKGGVIMDVTNAEQAKIAEDAGAVSVMALGTGAGRHTRPRRGSQDD